tara:strand:+ start:17517 stop:18509 length:993 start_codon:yes stop_codon:yes gene_type:complete
MATVLALTIGESEWHRSAYEDFAKCVPLTKIKKHEIVSDPEKADIILFIETGAQGHHSEPIRAHPYFKKYQEKCFVFGSIDHYIPFLPGFYSSVEKRWYNTNRLRTGFYLGGSGNKQITKMPWKEDLPYLFSFLGTASNHPVREVIMQLRHPRGFIKDTSGKVIKTFVGGNKEELNTLYQDFNAVMQDSKFILCPRGAACSSLRLFETMKAGRVPVILSDSWTPPIGPDWDSFSIRIPEADVEKIPEILEAKEKDAKEMARKARQEWEKWFSEEALFNTIVDGCLEIRKLRVLPEWLSYRLAFLYFLTPFHFRDYLRTRPYLQFLRRNQG